MNDDFAKGCLSAILVIALVACAVAFIWMVIGGPRL